MDSATVEAGGAGFFARLRGRRRRVPTTLQIEAVECGAACLQMVLASFGRHISLEALREQCGSTRDGIDAATLARVAEAHGLTPRAYSCDIAALRELALPQILFWNFDHFVVLEGWSGSRFHLKDPARGAVSLTEEEFSRSFTGIALTFERGPAFQRGGRKLPLLKVLLEHARGTYGAISVVFGLGFLGAVAAALIPGFTRIFVDDYLGQQFGNWLLPLLGGMTVALVFRVLLVWPNAAVLLQTRMAVALSARFLWHLFHLPFNFFVTRSPGEISARAQSATQIGATVSGPLVQIGVSLISIAVYAAAMMLFSPLLTGLCLGFLMLNVLVMQWITMRVRDGSALVQTMMGRVHGQNIQAASLVEDYKAIGAENLLFGRLLDVELDHLNAEQTIGPLQKLIAVAPVVASGLLDALVLGAGAWQVLAGNLTIGGLIGFYMLSNLLAGPVSGLLGLWNAVQMTSGPLLRLQDVLQSKPDPIFGASGTAPPPATEFAPSDRLSGATEVAGLGYRYGSGPPVLRDVSFSLAPGSMVAVVGPSGSGKTTLGRLLVGLMAPELGEIRFDGEAMADILPATLRGSIAYVDQAGFLFAGKIKDNITLWDQSLGKEEIATAARAAAVDEVIARRPGGYEGRIGEGGAGLSGGERQRLTVARALAIDPTFLVMDEATSALDTLSEEAVIDALRERGLTVVMVTHRASVIRRCDRVLLLEQGRLVAEGSPADLLARRRVGDLVEAS
jgi:NHLM bacteriocin system ABC transporter peptidase/ATP-binding protein